MKLWRFQMTSFASFPGEIVWMRTKPQEMTENLKKAEYVEVENQDLKRIFRDQHVHSVIQNHRGHLNPMRKILTSKSS